MSLDEWAGGFEWDMSIGPEGELTAAAGRALEAARRHPGRVRDSAFHLLAADALLTYACEAGLESDDPGVALQRILSVGWLR
jgi:hypothetical protein